jgi:hypothetical protein
VKKIKPIPPPEPVKKLKPKPVKQDVPPPLVPMKILHPRKRERSKPEKKIKEPKKVEPVVQPIQTDPS